MHRQMFALAVLAVVVSVSACTKKDANAITGTTSYTSVALSSSPDSFRVAVGDSAAFTPTATIEPQGVVIPNGTDNMTFAFSNSAVAHLNGSGFVQGDSVGTTSLVVTYTDVNHGFATTTLSLPVIVTSAP